MCHGGKYIAGGSSPRPLEKLLQEVDTSHVFYLYSYKIISFLYRACPGLCCRAMLAACTTYITQEIHRDISAVLLRF